MPSLITGVAAAEMCPRNTLRKSLLVMNEDTTDAIFLKRERVATPTVSATDHDIRIGPGGFWGMSSLQDGMESIQDRYTIVAAANTPRVAWFETEDVKR